MKMLSKTRLVSWISNYKVLIVIFFLFAAGASVQSVVQGKKRLQEGQKQTSSYNNYTIFTYSYFHLIQNKDLYKLYPKEHWDLYKYSPTFSLFFALFAYLPDAIGLTLWNLLNAMILLMAVYYLPHLGSKQKGLILLASVIELMTSMQNSQSNGLIAGLVIVTFGLLERKNYLVATFCVVCSVFIKPFGIVAFALFLLYPEKWKLALYSLFWFIILLISPLVVIGFDQLIFLYGSWADLLSMDHAVSYGYSVMGWLHSWFGIQTNKLVIVLIGMILFLLPFLKFRDYTNFQFRILALSSILLWIVIFNHKAESPTFIIAMAGVSLWFFTGRKTYLNIILFICAFILTSLSPTDIFPGFLRENLVKPYVLKAVPCIFIWFKVVYDMMALKTGFPLEEKT